MARRHQTVSKQENCRMAEERPEAPTEHAEHMREIDAAMVFASENAYAYGPKWSKRNLVWDVESTEARDSVVRVTLSYRPGGAFRGQPGSEWIEVQPDGTVTARNQIRSPKEDLPWVLIGVAAVAVIAAAVLVPWILFFNDPGADPDRLYVSGRTLWMRVSEVDVVPQLYYRGPDIEAQTHNYTVAPDTEGTEIAIIRVELHNQTSATAHLVIDEEAAILETADQVRHRPLSVDRIVVLPDGTEVDPLSNRSDFIPLWGSVDINGGESLTGMLIFEVPVGSEFIAVRWSATDSMIARY